MNKGWYHCGVYTNCVCDRLSPLPNAVYRSTWWSIWGCLAVALYVLFYHLLISCLLFRPLDVGNKISCTKTLFCSARYMKLLLSGIWRSAGWYKFTIFPKLYAPRVEGYRNVCIYIPVYMILPSRRLYPIASAKITSNLVLDIGFVILGTVVMKTCILLFSGEAQSTFRKNTMPPSGVSQVRI
jgi:hypothetical protein